MGLTLVTGGARSGKSVLAVRIAAASGSAVVVVATGEARDEEMKERIARHRGERPSDWVTVEEPVEVAGAIAAAPPEAVVIVDCLTLWVSNLLERGSAPDDVEARAVEAAKAAASRAAPVVVVTNEVGDGIVPMHPGSRGFRDLMGAVNTVFAEAAERALLVVAGRVVPLPRIEEVMSDVFDR